MVSVKKETRRLYHTVEWRGFLMAVLGMAAVIRPEDILIPALLAVGGVATLFGLYEASIAVAFRKRAKRWRLALAHALTSVTFGLLTVGVAAPALRWALAASAAWFLFYAAVAWSAALRVPRTSRVRTAVIAWAWFHAALALLVVSYPGVTIFAVLFLGAAYAALLGTWQIGVGIYLRRALRQEFESARQATMAAVRA